MEEEEEEEEEECSKMMLTWIIVTLDIFMFFRSGIVRS